MLICLANNLIYKDDREADAAGANPYTLRHLDHPVPAVPEVFLCIAQTGYCWVFTELDEVIAFVTDLPATVMICRTWASLGQPRSVRQVA